MSTRAESVKRLQYARTGAMKQKIIRIRLVGYVKFVRKAQN